MVTTTRLLSQLRTNTIRQVHFTVSQQLEATTGQWTALLGDCVLSRKYIDVEYRYFLTYIAMNIYF